MDSDIPIAADVRLHLLYPISFFSSIKYCFQRAFNFFFHVHDVLSSSQLYVRFVHNTTRARLEFAFVTRKELNQYFFIFKSSC